MTGIYNTTTGGTNWVLAGNQRILGIYAETRSTLGFNSSNRNQIQSSIDFNFEANPAGTDDQVIVDPPE